MTKRPLGCIPREGQGQRTPKDVCTIMYSPALASSPQVNPLPRFAGDWITAWIDLHDDTGLLHVGAGPREWVLEALAPHKLFKAMAGRGPLEVEFNPELLVLLVPGAHKLVGSSFFRLRS